MRGLPDSPWPLLTAALLGCAAPPPATITRPDPDAWTRCYRDFEPTADAPLDLKRLTDACGPPAGLVPVTPVHVGDAQAQDGPSERLTFRARPDRCYRLFAVAAPEVKDLDVALFDPDGHLITADVSHDRFSVVPPRGPLCVHQEGVLRVEIAVVQGAGDFVLQVWGQAPRPAPDPLAANE